MESKLLLLLASNFTSLDRELQKEVYHEFYALVYAPIMYMVKEHAATEDIIQESFFKTIRKLPVVENEAKLKSWIKTVARNDTYNYLRKSKKYRNELSVDSVFINNATNLTAAATVESEIELKHMTEAIGRCIQDLKQEYRILIEMRWKQNYSYKEIALELGINEDVVKSQLYRAREAVKKRFLKQWGDIK
jgi:RNA polymerase sigma-70 factor (ECF subfamily)